MKKHGPASVTTLPNDASLSKNIFLKKHNIFFYFSSLKEKSLKQEKSLLEKPFVQANVSPQSVYKLFTSKAELKMTFLGHTICIIEHLSEEGEKSINMKVLPNQLKILPIIKYTAKSFRCP